MALFGNKYKMAAKAELERKVREIEAKRKAIEDAESKESLDNQINDFSVLLSFSLSTELISAEMAESYERRVKNEAYELGRAQAEINSFGNEVAIAKGSDGFSMAEVTRTIEKNKQERELKVAEQCKRNGQTHEDDPERVKH
jgi:hypothetical protein